MDYVTAVGDGRPERNLLTGSRGKTEMLIAQSPCLLVLVDRHDDHREVVRVVTRIRHLNSAIDGRARNRRIVLPDNVQGPRSDVDYVTATDARIALIAGVHRKHIRADLGWCTGDLASLGVKPEPWGKLPVSDLPCDGSQTVAGLQFDLVGISNHSVGKPARRDRELLSRGIWTCKGSYEQ